MSLDLYIANEQYNYTYNAWKMWFEIYPEDERMIQIDGMTGKKARSKIKKAIESMVEHSEILRKLEPKNQWGSFNGFLSFLIELLGACDRHPKSKWKADR